MNIGLIGAPGAGKTTLAYQLSRQLEVYDPTCGCGERSVKIIDHYVPEIERKTQIALGPIADYLGNLYVALERYARERTARVSHDIVITCGTLIETAVYLAMHFVALGETLSPEERIAVGPRIDAALRVMSLLYEDTFSYDYAFYLPPVKITADSEFIDQQLQGALEGFKLIPVVALTDPEHQLEDALRGLRTDEVQAS